MSAVIVNPGYRPQASLRASELGSARGLAGREAQRGSSPAHPPRQGRVHVARRDPARAVGARRRALGAGGAAADAEGAGVGAGLEYVTVDAGASLWEIAVAIDPSADPRVVIDEIVRLNGLDDAVIEPGQRLAVPNAG